jgi:hypothetical protein
VLDITRGAQLTVEDGDRQSPRFVEWHSRGAVLDAVSRAAVSPPVGVCEPGEGRRLADETAVLESLAPV